MRSMDDTIVHIYFSSAALPYCLCTACKRQKPRKAYVDMCMPLHDIALFCMECCSRHVHVCSACGKSTRAPSPRSEPFVPSPCRLLALVQDLELRVAAGEKLYIHCWGGRGRAGTVGACLLASMYGIGADEALARVQRAFDTRKDNQRRSPETDEQHAFVRGFISSKLRA